MLDSWGICQPSAWAFQTMPHNVLDSPEKQPGAWKLPAHHLNSLIWALSGSPSLPLCLCVHLLPSLSISHFLSCFTLRALISVTHSTSHFPLSYSHFACFLSSDVNISIFLLSLKPFITQQCKSSPIIPSCAAPYCKTAADAPR